MPSICNHVTFKNLPYVALSVSPNFAAEFLTTDLSSGRFQRDSALDFSLLIFFSRLIAFTNFAARQLFRPQILHLTQPGFKAVIIFMIPITWSHNIDLIIQLQCYQILVLLFILLRRSYAQPVLFVNCLILLGCSDHLIQELNLEYGCDVPLVLMNSFNTNSETLQALNKLGENRPQIFTFEQNR